MSVINLVFSLSLISWTSWYVLRSLCRMLLELLGRILRASLLPNVKVIGNTVEEKLCREVLTKQEQEDIYGCVEATDVTEVVKKLRGRA